MEALGQELEHFVDRSQIMNMTTCGLNVAELAVEYNNLLDLSLWIQHYRKSWLVDKRRIRTRLNIFTP